MKKYLITAGLLFALSGVSAVAQTSTTPGVPAPNDPNTYPNAQESTTDQQNQDHHWNRDRSDSAQQQSDDDQQQYPDQRQQTDQYNNGQSQDNGQYQSDRDRQDQSSSDTYRNRDRNYNDQTPQSDRNDQYNQNDQYNNGQYNQNDQYNRNRSDNGYDQDRDRGYVNGGNSDLQSMFQQRSDLSNVIVNETDSRVELSGTVPSDHDRREAMQLARSYANGRRVVDRIQVNNGHRDDDQQ